MIENTFVTNPDVFVIQNRLYAPSHMGGGKWVVFNAKTRKAFLALGKDEIFPEIISILTLASASPISFNDLSEAGIRVTESKIIKLIECDLLRWSSASVHCYPSTFIERYQLANFNYPFFNYFDPQWKENDQKIMRQYARQWSHPLTMVERTVDINKKSYKLPAVQPQDLDLIRKTDNSIQKLSLKSLAATLKFVFGAIGELTGGDFGPWLRKTSPSGGARHPTEGVVFISHNYYSRISGGIYVYDIKNHRLVELAEEYDSSVLDSLDTNAIGFLIRSRVERAMWRYRDIRAFRPVLLDAGHVIETLKLLLGHFGIENRVIYPATLAQQNFSWLEEPELAMILAGRSESINNVSLNQTKEISLKTCSGKYLTNPGMYITFEKGFLTANILWPKRNRYKISFSDFKILTHCLPSTRGDRVTTVKGIAKTISDAEPTDISNLSKRKALLPIEISKNLYSNINLWVRYGWYLSLLAHLEVRAAIRECNNSPYSKRESKATILETVSADNLVSSLMKRVTTRSFSSKSISKDVLDKLLLESSLDIDLKSNTPIRLFVAASNVDGLESKLYRWDILTKEFISLDKHLTRTRIRELTIGQSFAAGGAATIWLQRELNLKDPARYELDIMELGQIGQRICLVTTAFELGLFLTPAVSDEPTFQEIGITKQIETVIYSFTIGHPYK